MARMPHRPERGKRLTRRPHAAVVVELLLLNLKQRDLEVVLQLTLVGKQHDALTFFAKATFSWLAVSLVAI